jgi:hypothetical protein
MRQSMMTVMALAAFGAMVATAQAENQTPQSSNRFTSCQEAERGANRTPLANETRLIEAATEAGGRPAI